ncbi:hypothetical protein KAX35_08300, partial [candidate division WOR-3 bacterium]|nr:hypothetical protein [candidate division WOR-3 bacterium]
LIQKEWLETAKDGKILPERYINKLNGRRGRVDILIEELGDDSVSVVEIKGTDWDRIKQNNLKHNIRRQIRQIWEYIESQLNHYHQQVCPGVIFPTLPKDLKRLALVESMFNAEGIQVIWHDESIAHLKTRMKEKAQQQNSPNGV